MPLLIKSLRHRRRHRNKSVVLRAPTVPTSQQINFYTRGIPPPGIGIPRVVGGAQRIALYLGGIDVTQYLMNATATYTLQLNTTGTCQFRMSIPAADSFRPAVGMSLLIQEFGINKFAGYVDHFDKTVYWGATPDLLYFDVAGVDLSAPTQRRLIAATFPGGTSLFSWVSYMCQTSMSGDKLVPNGVDPAIVVGDPFTFTYIKNQDALNQLTAATNTVWWVDQFGVIWAQPTANLQMSALVVEVGNGQQIQAGEPGAADALTETNTIQNYRNKQYIRTPTPILSQTVTLTANHTFTGAVGDIVCITLYALQESPTSVKENGVELVGTDRFFELKLDGTTVYPAGGDGYYWSIGFFGVWHWPSSVYPPNGTTLAVVYKGTAAPLPNVVIYVDQAEVDRMALVTGASGIFEEVESYNGVITFDAALALAQGIVELTAPPPKQYQLTTLQPIEGVGYLVHINLPLFGVVGDYIIQQIMATSIAPKDMGYGTSFQSQVTLVEQRTQGDWVNWFERLIARLNQNQVAAPTEKPTWALAFDQPGNPSPGLAVGVFGSAYIVQTSQYVIDYVAALFLDGPEGANIVIDIKKNGTSIFNSDKLKYRPADAGLQVLYGNFSPALVTGLRGDQLVLSVEQVGSDTPGKNGTVIVVISPAAGS